MIDQQYQHAKFCNDLGIRIYAKGINSLKCEIIIDNNGRIKKSQSVYNQYTDKQKENWSAKIAELYQDYYNFYKKKQPAPIELL